MTNAAIHLVGLSDTQNLGQQLAKQLSCTYEQAEHSEFPNEELKIRIREIGQTTIILASPSRPTNNKIIEFLLATDAIKRMGNSNIIAVMPWFPYSKQDKVFQKGEPLSAKVIASLILSSGAKQLITLDLHNPSISGYFDIPVANLSASELFVSYLNNMILDNYIVVSPDAGSIKNSTKIAQLLKLPISHISKTRDLNTGIVTINGLSGEVEGKNVLIFDDMIATASTLVEVSKFLHDHRAATINVYATHHLFIPGAQDKIETSAINSLTITNSIQMPSSVFSSKLRVLDISTLLTNAINEII